MKYTTATTEQRAGQVTSDGKPLAPNPPDDSGEWQLIGLHTFMRYEPIMPTPLSTIPGISYSCEWFIHFYWQRQTS